MHNQAEAKRLKERRSETRYHLNQDHYVELSTDGFNVTHKFRIWNKTVTSLSFLVEKDSDLLSQLEVGAPLDLVYYATESYYPRVYMGTEVRHITKFTQGRLTDHYLVGLKALEWQVSKEEARAVYFLGDNGGRRSGIDRRRFSYDAHIPERRSALDRRSGLDRRESTVFGVSRKSRDGIERRTAYA